MKTRLHGYICVFILLVITQLLIHAKVINDTRRGKREISIPATSQPRDIAKTTARNLEEVNLERKKNDRAPLEDDNTHLTEKHRISKRFATSVNTDLRPSTEKSTDYEGAAGYRVQRSNEKSDYTEEAEEETNKEVVARGERDEDRKTGNLVRLPRDVKFPDVKYTDQDERSSLYDDYEAKDVAKRGILGGPEDYEEAEDDSSAMEGVAALQEQELASNEADKTRNDARVKRDRAISEPLVDKTDLTPKANAPKLDESKVAEEDPSSRRVSLVESTRSSDEASDDIGKTKGSESNVAISRSNGTPEIEGPTGAIAPSADDDLKAEYEKRVEDEIQRKIDSIKEEIRRDIEAQERSRDIEMNNARFDQLQEREEDEEGRNVESEPIEKRQTVAKRSVREEGRTAAAFSKRESNKNPVKEQRKKLQRRAREIDKSNASSENKDVKRRSMDSSGQFTANRLVKRKREHDREMFLVNNDRKARKRRSRSYTSDRTDVRPKNELLADRDLNSYLYTDNKMLPASDSTVSENESNDVEDHASAAGATSLVFLTGSSQELSPRLAREYKEAFGGLQSEPGGALTRYKRVKRVLSDLDAKKFELLSKNAK